MFGFHVIALDGGFIQGLWFFRGEKTNSTKINFDKKKNKKQNETERNGTKRNENGTKRNTIKYFKMLNKIAKV